MTRGKAIINNQQPQAHAGNIIIIITDIELSSRGGYKDQNFSDSLPLIILRTLGSCVGIMEFIIQSPPATARPSVRVWPMAVVATILSCPLLILMKGWNSASQPGKYGSTLDNRNQWRIANSLFCALVCVGSELLSEF